MSLHVGATRWWCAFVWLAITIPTSRAADGSRDLKEVRALRAQCDASVTARDFESVGKLVGDRMVFAGPYIRVIGRDDFLTSLKNLSTKRPDVTFVHEIKQLHHTVDHPIIAESGVWKESWAEPDGKITLQGRYQAIWMQHDERWFLEAEQFVPSKCTGGAYCKAK